MLNLRDQQFQKFRSAARWVKPEWLQIEVAKLKSQPTLEARGYNGRSTNLNCVIEGQAAVMVSDESARDQTNSSETNSSRANSSSQSHNASSVFPHSF